jgi:hypothetical protein
MTENNATTIRKAVENASVRKIIDLEPTWGVILNLVKTGTLDAEELRKAVKVADLVRQAQKHHETLTFYPNGSVDVKKNRMLRGCIGIDITRGN